MYNFKQSVHFKMSSIKVLLLFIVAVLCVTDAFVVSGAARRRRQRKQHLANMKNKESIDILESENIKYHVGKKILCPMFAAYNSTTIYESEFIEKFVSLWREKIYTKTNFPETYDANKSVNISQEILHKFQEKICNNPKKPTILKMLNWFIILHISYIVYLMLAN